MAALTSTIYTDPAPWQNPDPGYAACPAVVGGGVNTGSEDVANSISNIATVGKISYQLEAKKANYSKL